MGHAKPEARGGKGVEEESSRGLQLPPISSLPDLEDMLEQQESRSRAAMTREDQQSSDGRVEKKAVPAPDYLSQKSQLTQAARSHQAQGQNELKGGSACSQLLLANPPEIERDLQSRSPEIIAVPDLVYSHQYSTDTIQSYSRQPFQSDFAIDTREKPRESLSKKSGITAMIKKAGREAFYSSPQEEKILSDRKHLEKESPDRKRREDAPRDQKRPPPNSPTSFPTQSRSVYPQSTARTSNGRFEVPLARHNSSRHKPKASQPESGTFKIGIERDQSSNSTVASRSEEEINPHAWERHLPQSVDDATIQREVLTLFEFIEHHVDDYYGDTRGRISQSMVKQLTKIPLSCLPDGTSLEELLERVRYKAPVIKHCLISLVVSGMSFQELAQFPLLPDEFTVLPRAIRNETVDTREKLCMYYHPMVFHSLTILQIMIKLSQNSDPYVLFFAPMLSKILIILGDSTRLYTVLWRYARKHLPLGKSGTQLHTNVVSI